MPRMLVLETAVTPSKNPTSVHGAAAGQRRHRLAAIRQKSIARRLVRKGERMDETVAGQARHRQRL